MLGDLGWAALVAAGAIGAWLRGERRERLAAGAFAGLWAAAWLAGRLFETAPSWLLMGADGAVLVLLVRLTWKSPGAWPAWAAGFEAVAVAASLAYALQPEVGEAVYLRALLLARSAAALALAVGAWRRRAQA